MPGIALGVSYCGSDFHGWQYQGKSIPTIQGHLESALSIVADHPVQVTCAGRTDAGVHATQQIVHFHSQVSRPLKAWVLGVNAHLPDSIAVNWSRDIPSSFNARHSAVARRYFYVIYNQSIRSGLFAGLYTRERRKLNLEYMHEAGQFLLGENDFSSFRAAHCQSRTPMRNVHHLKVSSKAGLILIDIQANAFLHHMVRNIAAVLMDIGAGQKPVTWTKELLNICDRSQASITAPPHGLYFVEVIYPDYPQIPAGAELPHFMSPLEPVE